MLQCSKNSTEVFMGYGNAIKNLRKSLGMSLRKFGELVEVGYTHLSLLEREISYSGNTTTHPSIDLLKQICDKTHYPFRQFLEDAGYIDPVPAPEPSPLQQIYDKLDANRKDILMHTAELLLNQMGEVTEFPDNDKIVDNIGKIN
jgi:transcriptional regulator with XRE-family HTH domain